jgi:hypothetical protein
MFLRRFAVPLGVLVAFLAGCNDDDSTPNNLPDGALVCEAPAVVGYARAGCGAAAPAPYCQGPTDACITSFCDCDGTTHGGGCGFALRPYLHAGPCEDATDGGAADGENDALAEVGDGALVCGSGFTIAYMQAGCGPSAPAPYCQGPTDACTVPYCDCDGTTHAGGCGFALRPFLHAGPCTDGGDGGADASDGRTD